MPDENYISIKINMMFACQKDINQGQCQSRSKEENVFFFFINNGEYIFNVKDTLSYTS